MAAAPRRTDRRLLIVGILVILLGGILAASAARMLTRQSQVLALARDVPAGQAITAADLSVADVSVDPRLTPIPAGQRDVVVGKQAQIPLTAGTLLTWRELGSGPGFGVGEEVVALPLADGRLPARGLRMGQTVVVVPTPSSTAPSRRRASQSSRGSVRSAPPIQPPVSRSLTSRSAQPTGLGWPSWLRQATYP